MKCSDCCVSALRHESRTGLVAVLGASLALLLAACSKGPTTNDPSSVIRLSDVGWTDITSTTAMAASVLEALGYTPEVEVLSVAVTYASLKNGDLDAFLGTWMPSQTEMIRPYLEEGSIETIATNLEGAKFTLAVPAYAAQAGLRDFADIARFRQNLDGKIYGIEPGNEGNEKITTMIENNAFGLGGFELVVSSEQGMLTQVQRAIERGTWIVFLGWAPHPMNTNMKITYLSGGDAIFGPDYGGATVHTIVRKGLAESQPNVTRLLRNITFTLDMENEMMRLILDEKMEPRAAARQWLSRHPEVLREWTDGVVTVDGQDAQPAIDAAFQLSPPASKGL